MSHELTATTHVSFGILIFSIKILKLHLYYSDTQGFSCMELPLL